MTHKTQVYEASIYLSTKADSMHVTYIYNKKTSVTNVNGQENN